jgi:hypothetical protein
LNTLFPRNISFQGAKRIYLGIYQSAIIRNDSQVFSSGLNEFYGLGDGTNINKNTPTEISYQNYDVIDVSAGYRFMVILTAGRKLLGVGLNNVISNII